VVPAGRVASRGLLLLLLAFGVAAMHTLGHPGGGHCAASPAAQPMTDPAGASARAATESHATGSHPGALQQLLVGVAPPCGAGIDPFDLCLAVLTAVGVAALIRLLPAARYGSGAGAPVPLALAVAGCGPPRPAVGLVLADLSVLRR